MDDISLILLSAKHAKSLFLLLLLLLLCWDHKRRGEVSSFTSCVMFKIVGLFCMYYINSKRSDPNRILNPGDALQE